MMDTGPIRWHNVPHDSEPADDGRGHIAYAAQRMANVPGGVLLVRRDFEGKESAPVFIPGVVLCHRLRPWIVQHLNGHQTQVRTWALKPIDKTDPAWQEAEREW